MNLHFLPQVASTVAEHCASLPLWEVKFKDLLVEAIRSDANQETRIPVELHRGCRLPDFIGIYLSALISHNRSEDLLEFGGNAVAAYAAANDIASLVGLTNFVFKELSLVPPTEDDDFRRRCIDVNFHLHVSANQAIHAIRTQNADYYAFTQEIDAFLQTIPCQRFPKRLCFVFLTANYLDNFHLWIDIFGASTRGREHLLIVGIEPGVREHVQCKLNAIAFDNVTVVDFFPSRPMTACGNGINLNYLWYLRIKIVRYLVSSGHDLICSDLDSFWLRDFVRIWENSALSNTDIAFMPCWYMPAYAVEQWGATPCAGFFACRASERLSGFLLRWEQWVEVMFDDQIGLAQMLLDGDTEWGEQNDSPEWRSLVWDPGLVRDRRIDYTVKLSLLNPALARRVIVPDLVTAEGATIWHPRWIAAQQEHEEIAATLVEMAAASAYDP